MLNALRILFLRLVCIPDWKKMLVNTLLSLIEVRDSFINRIRGVVSSMSLRIEGITPGIYTSKRQVLMD